MPQASPLLTIPQSPAHAGTALHPPIVGLATVLDGDTIDIAGQRIRLWGVDAFEAAQRCDGPSGPGTIACGAMATRFLTEQVSGVEVACAWRDVDRYQRTVAQCRVGDRDIGAALVRAGWAMAYTRYTLDYSPDERVARAGATGAWAGNFVLPWEYRSGERSAVATAQRSDTGNDCSIKGNITSTGDRIYHLPGEPGYDQVRPEAMFCSEAAAAASGFRRRSSQ